MIYTCKHCGKEFNDKACDKRVFCSRQCKSVSERAFDPVRLAALAEDGLENRQIAASLSISRARVTRILHIYGLHDLWRCKRYERRQREVYGASQPWARKRKRSSNAVCINSLLAGWKCPEILGASETANTPLQRSA